MKPKNHTQRAMREIAAVIHHVRDEIALWYKVNWIIISTSHAITDRRGTRAHVVRQKIRHRLWRMAQRRHWVLKRYVIPREINGNSKCITIWYYKIFDIFLFSRPPKRSTMAGRYYNRNVPALISAIIIGIFILLVPLVNRKTIYDNITQMLNYFNPGSPSDILTFTYVFLILVISFLFLINGLGYKPNRYSKYAGYLSIFYFLLISLENIFLVENTDPVFISGITPVSYWVASFGVGAVGIVYLLFFETVDFNKKDRWKNVSFTIVCGLVLFSVGIIMPVILSPAGFLTPENILGGGASATSQYHVGEIATDQTGQQGYAIISDDGQGRYTVVPVYLDNSRKGWHTNGKVDPQVIDYQTVEQRYPVRWPGGRMDITHIPTQDPTIGSSLYNVITPTPRTTTVINTPPSTIIPATTQRTSGNAVPITEILNRHNYYRSAIPGAGIPNLVWSSTLANSAQSWANYLGANNAFEHSGGQYGENLAAGFPSWSSAVDAWGSEKSHFVYAPFGNDSSDTGYWGDVGHYTQVIWKTTTACGCGSAPHPTYGTVYVCQYDPAGNIGEYYPY